ncbi:MAG: shikimate 5-dehydrogenase [Frankiales bacterium]|nr:shikimate 5-dehydrogenase [Frankiales bacterium]
MRAAVLGRPIAHSLSPALHRAAYAALGLDWTYDAVDCGPDELPAFLSSLRSDWAGLSLTMPLKQAVLPLLDSVSDLARDVAAANTVVLSDGRRHGENTDVHGILAALAEAGVTSVERAVVLGGGATARSALAALASLGCTSPTLVVRSEPVDTLAAADRLGVQPVVASALPASYDLLISTLPAGAGDSFAPYVRDVPALLDVVYDPWPTALAAACGGVVVSGAAMLLHQAAEQVHLMTGFKPPVDAMRDALPGLKG